LVVVDPRRTETAKLADTHLFIHPARDAWFLIALLKEVMASPMRPALPTYVRGLDAVEAAIAPFDPAACAAIAGGGIGRDPRNRRPPARRAGRCAAAWAFACRNSERLTCG